MILLLGASGFLGNNVLRLLASRGETVCAPVRNLSSLSDVVTEYGPGRVIALKEDITDFSALLSVCHKHRPEAIINCAGTTDMSLPDLSGFMKMNYELPAMLPGVMKACGILTLVHVSTANTIGIGSKEHPADERSPFAAPFDAAPYAQSKKMGEDLLLKFAASRKDYHIIIVNPGFMVGAFDRKPSSGTLLDTAYRKPVMAAPRGGKSFIHVRDAACAIVNALKMGESGERYLLTGEAMTLKEFYRLQKQCCGYFQIFFTLPDWTVRLAGRFGDFLRRHGKRSMASSVNCELLLVEEHYDNKKAATQLKMPCTPIRVAIEDYFRFRGTIAR